MKKKIVCIFVGTLLVATIIPVAINATDFYDPLDGGWIEDRDGVTILHVSGNNYEMGYQHGFLLREKVLDNVGIISDFLFSLDWSYDDVLEVWKIQEIYLHQEYKDELQGLADGCGLTFEEVAVYNTWPGVYNHLFSCWGAAAWSDATIDGKLIHFRSCDGSSHARDSVTGEYYHDNQALIVRNPDIGYSSVYPIYIGDIISIGGFNEKGVGVSELTIVCSDTTFHGINSGYRMRMVLDHASDVNEAVNIMNSNRTCGWNFIISDGNSTGVAIEQSANFVYTGSCFDLVENTEPFWQIKDIVRRGNCYINPFLASFERERYDPSGIKGLILFLLDRNGYYATWLQYKSISKEYENLYGLLDLNNSMNLLREVYNGKTNILFRYILTDKVGTGYQWVAIPVTGDLYICFAEGDIDAYKNPVHHFNLYELLDSEPP